MKATSLKAYEKSHLFSGTHRERILQALEHCDMTALEISTATGLNQFQVSRRMSELEKSGQIRVISIKNGFSVYSTTQAPGQAKLF